MKLFLSLILACLYSTIITGQKKNASYELHIYPASAPLHIDGMIDEAGWQKAEVARNFFMVNPMDTSYAKVKTEVAMTYDTDHLYLYAICYNSLPGPYMVESLRRDFTFTKNDNFLVFIDPFEDQTNGFAFGTNAAGAQWDGLMYEGGKVDLSWENKWISEVKQYDDRWVLEMAIPFKTLRYKKDLTRWGINFSRNDLKTTEKSSWAPVPRQFPTASLAYTGILVWDVAPPVPGANVSLIPYALGGVSKSYNPPSANTYRHTPGLDAKVAITSSLNLDLTLNPDFSQVEVDKQVTNLDRYELFFPEKRQFFLENGDQFNNFGYANIRPFFSRRIGLGVPIHFGARLSGKLNQNWRISLLDMKTAKQEDIGLPAQNFTVFALQRKVFARSNIGILMVNKQVLNYVPDKDSSHLKYSSYNRNIGLEYNLASSNNLWTGKALVLKSFTPAKKGNDFSSAANLQYASKKWAINAAYEYAGRNYNAEVGYVPRHGYIKLNPQIAYFFFPAKSAILTHGPQLSASYFYNERFHKTDNETQLSYLLTFRNKSTLAPFVADNYVQLLFPFDPTNRGKDTLHTGSLHNWNTIGINYISKPQSLLTYSLSVNYGGYYADGKKFSVTGDIGYRFQPVVNIAFSTSYNELALMRPWGRTRFWNVGPKIDITFTNKLFFTTYFQYNQQFKNTNINTRLQWRYKPASDLFIVYTDNYLIAPFSVRNRALVIKFNYWWNL